MPSQKPSKFPLLRILFPRIKSEYLLIGIGLVFISLAVAWKINRSNILGFDGSTFAIATPAPQPISNPVTIAFPDLNLELGVTEAKITDGTWEISNTGASHWENSADPGQAGNIVIYGHNLNHLFGPIQDLTKDGTIILTNEQGVVTTYKIEKTVTVEPTEIEYVLPTDQETLTVYTCTGFLDSKRFIVIAKPIEETN